MDPEQIANIIANLGDATPEQLAEARAFLRGRADELAVESPTQENYDQLAAVKDQFLAVIGEQERRANYAADLAVFDTHDASQDQIPPVRADGVPTPGQQNQDADSAGEGQQSAGSTATDQGNADGGDQAKAGEQGTASGQAAAGNLGQLNNQGKDDGRNVLTRVTARTIVAGEVPGFAAGQALTDDTIVQAFTDKAMAINRMSLSGDTRYDVARIQYDYPAERTLDGTDVLANTEKFQAGRDSQRDAIVAAGGLCQPLEVMYDIKTVGVQDRPIRDSLTNFNAGRGGIQYRTPFDALAMTEGLGIWTQADDQAVSPTDDTTWKTCLVVDCPGTVTASIYSTYMCLQFANMTSRFDPEWVRATTQSSLVSWSRFAENQLLGLILSGSKLLHTNTPQLGAIRDVLATYDKVISYYRSKHRLNDDIPLRTIMPRWLIDMLRADIARQFTNGDPGTLFGVAQAELESWFRTRNVNVTWHLDGLAAATVNSVAIPQQFYSNVAAGALVPPWPSAVDTALFVEGDWLHLDGGTLDLGLVRDSQLNLQNRYQTFVETFEGVAFMGIESLRVVLPLTANGSSSGTRDPKNWDDPALAPLANA